MKPNRALLLVWVVALLLRIIPVILTANVGLGLDDVLQYNDLAQNILAGKGYVWYGGIPTAFRAPLYPAFLAVIYFLFDPDILSARIIQALLGSLLPVLIYFLGKRILGETKPAITAAWLVALYPPLWIYPIGLATENLYVPLVSLLVLSILWAQEGQVVWRFVIPGVVIGLATLTRSVIAAFLPILLFWIWHYTKLGFGDRLKRMTMVVIPFVVLTVPWSIRNSLLYGEFMFIESNLGFNLYMGYHPNSEGTFDAAISLELLDKVNALERMSFQVEKDIYDLGMAEAMEFIRRDPGRVLYLIVSKISYLFRFDTRGAMYYYTNNLLGPLPTWLLLLVAALLILPTAFVLIMAAGGGVMAGWGAKTGLIVLLILYNIGIHALIFAEPRFLLPLIPLFAIYAAKGLHSLPSIFTSPRLRLAVLALWLLLFLNWGWEFWAEAGKWAVLLGPGGNTAQFNY